MVKKYMKTTKSYLIFITILSIFLLLAVNPTKAAECKYGKTKAYFSKDGTNWQNATVENMTRYKNMGDR